MFRKQVKPALAGAAILVALGAIQAVYWFKLVYSPQPQGERRGGGGPVTVADVAFGRRDVRVETVAGDGVPGYEDGPGWRARFCGPNALALAPDGALLVADSRNHRIRRVTPGGRVSTLAGGGDPAGAGGRADGAAADARFSYPCGVAADRDGTVFIADTGNHRICRLRSGRVETLAGGSPGHADGEGAAARFRLPAALHPDADGALWVLHAGDGAVRRVDAAGRVTSPAEVPAEVAASLGDRGTAPGTRILFHSMNGTEPPSRSQFFVGRLTPSATARSLRVVSDVDRHVILSRRDGEPFLLLAGRVFEGRMPAYNDGEGHRASFSAPCAAVVAPDGTVYVAEYEGHRIRRLRLPEWLLAEG